MSGCAGLCAAANVFTEEAFKDYNTMVVHVKADSERDLYQTGIGAHVSQSRYFYLLSLLPVLRPVQ